MAKSMRNAFIRVSRLNITDKGVIAYDYKELLGKIQMWSETKELTYFGVVHDDDKENVHYHFVLCFKNPTAFEYIKAIFPHGKIESPRNVKSTVQYLIHLNNPEKFQYKWEDIDTNCENINKYKVTSVYNEEVSIKDILGKIDRGEIRKHNQYELISIDMYSKYKTRIQNAFEYYEERIVMDKNRNINVIFITGDTGTGKTVLSKYLCEKGRWSYCISSSSNDPLQDYKGEDVLILDDARDSSFGFIDLLKLLDNNTRSSVKSRYRNKYFLGHTIIITSYDDLDAWYNKNDEEFNSVPTDARRQLYRRIKDKYVILDENKVSVYTLIPGTFDYQFRGNILNPIAYYERVMEFQNRSVAEALGIEFIDEDNMSDVTCDSYQLGW